MDSSADLPPDLAAAHAMILAERAARLAEAANAQAKQSSTEALIAHLKLEIEKLRRTIYGARSERSARLLDQLELELEELEAGATEDELAAEKAAGKTQTVRSFERKRPVRQPCHASPTSRWALGSEENLWVIESVTGRVPFALKAGMWFRRARLVILSPDSRPNPARRQAETPLINLFRSAEPARPTAATRVGSYVACRRCAGDVGELHFSGRCLLRRAVLMSVAITATRSAPRSEPANNHAFLPRAEPRAAPALRLCWSGKSFHHGQSGRSRSTGSH